MQINEYELLTKPVLAAKLTERTMAKAEVWCGGNIVREANTDIRSLKVPNIEFGYVTGFVGDMLFKDPSTGRFNVMKDSEFFEVFRLKPKEDLDPEPDPEPEPEPEPEV